MVQQKKLAKLPLVKINFKDGAGTYAIHFSSMIRYLLRLKRWDDSNSHWANGLELIDNNFVQEK